MTSWWRRRRGRFWVQIVLAVVVAVAAFIVAALVSTAARSHVPAVLLAPLLILAVLAVARLAGILYALAVGVAAVEAFDWYFLSPRAASVRPPCSRSACSWRLQSSSVPS